MQETPEQKKKIRLYSIINSLFIITATVLFGFGSFSATWEQGKLYKPLNNYPEYYTDPFFYSNLDYLNGSLKDVGSYQRGLFNICEKYVDLDNDQVYY